MCGFLITRKRVGFNNDQIREATRSLARRGPDGMGYWSAPEASEEYAFQIWHFLLDISGQAIQQPLRLKNGMTIVFNGELYGIDALSEANVPDTLRLGELIESKGLSALQGLEGEFALCIYDPVTPRLTIVTDQFMTKPIYIGSGADPSEFGISSYRSALELLGFHDIVPFLPNSINHFVFSSRSLVREQIFPFRDWDVGASSYDAEAWEIAFRRAVRERATHGAHKPYLFLSSGYDSGAISLALNLEGIEYNTISLASGENLSVLNSRIEINRPYCGDALLLEGLSKADFSTIKMEMRRIVEPFQYSHLDNDSRLSLFDDPGAVAGFYLAQVVSKRGGRVVLSGCGADEIFSDYGFNGERIFGHSEFGGRFPDDLKSIFPWRKFYGDTLRSYLFKDEFILGSLGLEGRYPFLERGVVQSFLSLPSSIKNRFYKAPLALFLKKYSYPMEENKKRGFSPRRASLYRRLKGRLLGTGMSNKNL